MASYSKFINNLSSFGLSKKDFEKEKELLSKKFKQTANDSDILWSLYNKLVMKTSDKHKIKSLYYEMALFLNYEGKDYSRVRQESERMELMSYKELGVVKKVEICKTDSSCEECKKMQGKVFTLDEALEKMPIPNSNCSFNFTRKGKPFCRCTYLPVVD